MNLRRYYEGAAKPYLIALLAAGLMISASIGLLRPSNSWAAPSGTLPFAPGERLRFSLRWTVVPAGEAILEVLPIKTIDGQKVYHFRLTAETNAFVDLFYKVRDRIDAFASIDMTRAVRYHHKQREGDNHKDVEVQFDWQKEIALFTDGKNDKEVEIKPGTFDPLSVFYFSRMADFRADGLIQCPVSDGKKCVNGQARIIKKETIKIISGKYETYLIEPDLKHVGGVFEKSKDAKIRLWVTADEKHLPVKIASKVAIGSFVGELTAIENVDPRQNIESGQAESFRHKVLGTRK
jgi:hypothetical protein